MTAVNEHKRVKKNFYLIYCEHRTCQSIVSVRNPKHEGAIRFGTHTTFCRIKNTARKVGLHINQGKTKYMIMEQKNSSKQNKIGQLIIQNYTFERVENFKLNTITIT